MSREAMQMALEALEDANDVARMEFSDEDYYSEAINALRQALKAKQKTAVSPDGGTGFIDGVWHGPGPKAWQCQCGKAYTVTCISSKPAKREWVGLTDEEIEQGCKESWVTEQAWQSAAWWAEAKLKEKNHG